MVLRQADITLLFFYHGYNTTIVLYVALQMRTVHYYKHQKQLDQWGTIDPTTPETPFTASKVTSQMVILFSGKFSFLLQVLHLMVY